MNLQNLKKRQSVFKRLFGISPQQFSNLVEDIEPLWRAAELQRRTYKGRKNDIHTIGSGRRYRLDLEHSIAMLLLYYRTYVPHIVLAELFGIHDSGVCRYFKKLQPIVASVFDVTKERIDIDPEEVLRLCIDATEQESEKRDGSGYSGKKKRQTLKAQMIVDDIGKVHHVSLSVRGNMHDKRLHDETELTLPEHVPVYADLGYQGTKHILPYKKPKNKELTEQQKQYNHFHSSLRIIVEHVFAHLKKWGILKHRFRNNPKQHHAIFTTIAGLYNLKFSA